MLVTTVHDPEVFAADCMADHLYRALMCRHATDLVRCHVLIVDQGNSIGNAVRDKLAQFETPVFQRLSAALTGMSVIRRPVIQKTYDALSDMVLPTTATALALSDSQGIDATLVSPDGKVALGLALGDHLPDNLRTLSEYAETRSNQPEATGPHPDGMPQRRFVEAIVEPFVRWSSKLSVIDRYVGQARFGWNPAQPDSSNWPAFKRTIQCLYRTWADRCRAEKMAAFEIVTEPNPGDKWGAEWQTNWCQDGVPGDCNLQARLIGESLELGSGSLVRLVRTRYRNDPRRDLSKAKHDRFLVSNLGHVLCFPAGFDLIGPNGFLREFSVFLQRNESAPSDEGAPGRMLAAADLGVWRYEAQA